jgi:aerobic carbon-monoxide dehydrogenase large subunit
VTSHAKPTGWVGRSIRRIEDPALVTGQGRFTGDLAAEKWVRFVRSPVASGRITRILAPDGVMLVTAAEVAALLPIAPMLHKFNYAPIAQPILAAEVVRFTGEPVAVVVADSREAAEDAADLVTVEIEETAPLVDAMAALASDAPAVHAIAPGNVIVEGLIKTAQFDAVSGAAHRRIKVEVRSRLTHGAARGPCGL